MVNFAMHVGVLAAMWLTAPALKGGFALRAEPAPVGRADEEKNLGEGAVDVGGGGEVAAEGFEPSVRGDFVAGSAASTRVVNTQRGALRAALASVGESKFAARRGAGRARVG